MSNGVTVSYQLSNVDSGRQVVTLKAMAVMRSIQFPDETELPRGRRRDLAWLLFYLYRVAHRPTLREISTEIRNSSLRATASPETIRRLLRGTTVPSWPIVVAVFVTLCDIHRLNS